MMYRNSAHSLWIMNQVLVVPEHQVLFLNGTFLISSLPAITPETFPTHVIPTKALLRDLSLFQMSVNSVQENPMSAYLSHENEKPVGLSSPSCPFCSWILDAVRRNLYQLRQLIIMWKVMRTTSFRLLQTNTVKPTLVHVEARFLGLKNKSAWEEIDVGYTQIRYTSDSVQCKGSCRTIIKRRSRH